MADQTTEPNFRFSMLMRWAPPFVLVLGLLFLVMGYYLVGGLLSVAGLIFWLIVRRRKEPAAPEAKPAQPGAQPSQPRAQPSQEKAPPTT